VDFVTVEQPAVVLCAVPEPTVTETPTPTTDNEDGKDGLRPNSSPLSPLTDYEVPSSKGDSTGLLDSVCTVPLNDDPVTTRTFGRHQSTQQLTTLVDCPCFF
jgi:hypothetical protein